MSDVGLSADEQMMNEGFTDPGAPVGDPSPPDQLQQPAPVVDPIQEQALTPGQAKALRDEAARYRTEAQRYKQVFNGYEPDDEQALFEFIQAIQNDPGAAAQFAKEYYEATTGQMQQQQIEAEQPLTKAEFAQMMRDRDQAQQQSYQQYQQQQQLTEINRQVQELGYDTNAAWTPETWQTALATETVLRLAVEVTGGDLKKADEIYKAQSQQAIGSYVQGRQQDARNNPLPLGNRGGPAATGPSSEKTGWELANEQIAAIAKRNNV